MVQFASYLRRVLCKTRLIFPRINGPIVARWETKRELPVNAETKGKEEERASLAVVVVVYFAHLLI